MPSEWFCLTSIASARRRSPASTGGGKARAEAADARSDLAEKLSEADAEVLVNSASYRVNLDAMGPVSRPGATTSTSAGSTT